MHYFFKIGISTLFVLVRIFSVEQYTHTINGVSIQVTAKEGISSGDLYFTMITEQKPNAIR